MPEGSGKCHRCKGSGKVRSGACVACRGAGVCRACGGSGQAGGGKGKKGACPACYQEMTEGEWLATNDDTWRMLHFMEEKGAERKFRLFAAARCRRLWDWLPPQGRALIELAERHADGAATDEDLREARDAVEIAGYNPTRDALVNLVQVDAYKAAEAVLGDVHTAVFMGSQVLGTFYKGLEEEEAAAARRLVRDIFGNPFRPVRPQKRWLSPTAVALARDIYKDHAFDRLPILADALEEAGCDETSLLQWCREPGPHYRGCWGVDLVLRKEVSA